MKKCEFCGEEVPDRATFCPSCGKSVTREAEAYQ
ncbi:MAG: zinc-ribbon domain-containing protein, partial [Pyrinomonadaceae bacterium]